MTFSEIWSEINSDSLLGETRSRYLHGLLKTTNYIYGAVAEVGVFRGVTSKLMRQTRPDSTLHLFDTFSGIFGVDPAIDRHRDGEFNCSIEEVKKYLNADQDAEIYFHQGVFPDTFTGFDDVPFAFVFSDTDTFHGTKSTLDVFWPVMSPGGIILFDDYRFDPCPGVEKALHEWSDKMGVEIMVAPSGGQAFVIKQ